MNHNTRIAIIGGGASGLMTAVLLARQGFSVTIIEQKDKIGKKLLTTGNGRCNISNRLAESRHYFSRTDNLMAYLLSEFPVTKALAFFESIGITVKELEKGKLYPYSLEAKSVVKAFLYELEYLGVPVLYQTKVTKLEKREKWLVKAEQKVEEAESKGVNEGRNPKTAKDGKKTSDKTKSLSLSFDQVILCSGGMSYAVSGSDGSGYELARKLGHTIIKPMPAIVQLVMNEKQFPYYKHLSGTKTEARVRLLDKTSKQIIRQEEEEFLFTSYGVSGPAVLLLSTNVAYAQANHQKLELSVNFFPEKTKEELAEFLLDKIEKVPHFTIEQIMEMMVPNRLIGVLLKLAQIESAKPAEEVRMPELKRLLDLLTDLRLEVVSAYQWQQAQVTAGGVSCLEVCPKTLESRKAKGLYLAGEVLDIDGDCGGFNLQWAWTSAMAVAKAICQ
ncbi:aminoacetone oxidase family FAD-binding enzyme [Clostridiales bacterium COT073_COT-073]|nr:aminoacetone oxidase family FAD-binding enzyme [Clostridiales bacterium COT073_COT-073]